MDVKWKEHGSGYTIGFWSRVPNLLKTWYYFVKLCWQCVFKKSGDEGAGVNRICVLRKSRKSRSSLVSYGGKTLHTTFLRFFLDVLRDLPVLPAGTILCSESREEDQVAMQIVPVPPPPLSNFCFTGRAFCISSLTWCLRLSQNHIFPGLESISHRQVPRCLPQIFPPTPPFPFLTLPPVKESALAMLGLQSKLKFCGFASCSSQEEITSPKGSFAW